MMMACRAQCEQPMRLNKTTNHAIRILIDCAQTGSGLVKVTEISRRLGITPQNAFKVVHLLVRAGFIKAVRGRRGGVRLGRPAAAIRIGDVVRAMEATVFAFGEGDEGDAVAAPMTALLDGALEAFIAVLNGHTLADMAVAARAGAGEAGEAPLSAREAVRAAARRGSAGAGNRPVA
jgi:Rrf2 family protein